ncbi:hypothetical protein GCM10023107_71860 [Actinoplanes octamycinicus]|nr:hypothetical protein Aoc01nite_60800 [Actinoplanes octamycinicus]
MEMSPLARAEAERFPLAWGLADVLLTGGSGYIGSWCVLVLLSAGLSVRTTVRARLASRGCGRCCGAAVRTPGAELQVVRADLSGDDGRRSPGARRCCTSRRRRRPGSRAPTTG